MNQILFASERLSQYACLAPSFAYILIEMLTSKRKPQKCPSCGSKKVAKILWGYPDFSSKLEKNLKEGKIVLGGCDVSHNDPKWQCVDCKAEIYKEGQGRLGSP